MDEPQFENQKRLYWAALLAILLGLTALYHAVTRDQGRMSLQQDAEGRILVVLQRKRDGHFSAKGEINGQPVSFLVDTGATDVAVSQDMARELGLEFGPRVTVMTAAGPVGGWLTRLDSVLVGALGLRDVRATIAPGLGDEALLGMSFLSHFSIVQEGDTLVIASAGADKP